VKVGDYYRHQLALLVAPASPGYIAPRAQEGGFSQSLHGEVAMSYVFKIPDDK
jgi:hypothetical protein